MPTALGLSLIVVAALGATSQTILNKTIPLPDEVNEAASIVEKFTGAYPTILATADLVNDDEIQISVGLELAGFKKTFEIDEPIKLPSSLLSAIELASEVGGIKPDFSVSATLT